MQGDAVNAGRLGKIPRTGSIRAGQRLSTDAPNVFYRNSNTYRRGIAKKPVDMEIIEG
jgi:hypothetical protein